MKFYLCFLAFLLILISCNDKQEEKSKVSQSLSVLEVTQQLSGMTITSSVVKTSELDFKTIGSCQEYEDIGRVALIYNFKRGKPECVFFDDQFHPVIPKYRFPLRLSVLYPNEKHIDRESYDGVRVTFLKETVTPDMNLYYTLDVTVIVDRWSDSFSVNCVPQLAIDRGYFENGLPIEVDGICETTVPREVYGLSAYLPETRNYEVLTNAHYPPLVETQD